MGKTKKSAAETKQLIVEADYSKLQERIFSLIDRKTINSDLEVTSVNMTPDLARLIISNSTEIMNRGLDKRHIELLRYILVNNLWKFPSPPVILDNAARLLDGQHRLSAVISSGVSAKVVLILGADPTIMDAFDEGKKRSLGDRLKIRGFVNAYELSAVVRASLWITLFGGVYRRIDQPEVRSTTALIDYAETHKESILHSMSVVRTLGYARSKAPMSISSAGALHHRITVKAGKDEADAFLYNLVNSGLKRFAVFRESIDRARDLNSKMHRPRREDQIRIALVTYERTMNKSLSYNVIDPEIIIHKKILAG